MKLGERGRVSFCTATPSSNPLSSAFSCALVRWWRTGGRCRSENEKSKRRESFPLRYVQRVLLPFTLAEGGGRGEGGKVSFSHNVEYPTTCLLPELQSKQNILSNLSSPEPTHRTPYPHNPHPSLQEPTRPPTHTSHFHPSLTTFTRHELATPFLPLRKHNTKSATHSCAKLVRWTAGGRCGERVQAQSLYFLTHVC